ncbi:MAG: zinc-binding protein [Candidatus Magasanikbacteria bacterium]|nr:zinc-binding protein [Candidatus Magasanikbacteria bacterium]
MAFDNSTRQMFDVDLSCAKCGNHISQLPFQPNSDRPVYCADCNRAYRDSNRGSGGGRSGGGFSRGPRQMFDVNVDCAGCGAKITQLPFQPTGDKPVYCRDCMQARRNG